MLKFTDLIILLLFCALIYYLSSQPSLNTPMLFPHQDKLFHLGAYSIMAVCAWRSFRHLPLKHRISLILSVIFSSFYGLSDEWHQSYVPGRTASLADWAADSIGALLAALLIFKWTLNREECKVK